MTRYTLLGAGHAGTEAGVRAVVAGGDGGKEAGDLGARWSADPEHTARMRAVRTSFWTSRHDVDLEGVLVQVQGGTRNRVWTAGGVQIGTGGRIGFWSPVPTLDLSDDVPLHHAVFLVWLDFTFTRCNNQAAAAAT